MKVNFLNVGQGDSIILEWQESKISKIGIIDCCKNKGRNPVIEFLATKENFQISFVVLSHPHKDHFSGLIELFNYVKENNISIDFFFHTISVHPRYLNWSALDEEEASILEEIILTAIDFADNLNIIKSIQVGVENWSCEFDNKYKVILLSPSDKETRTYTSKIDYFKEDNKIACSSAANLLSTIFLIENSDNNKKLLLTSDAEILSFERLLESKKISILEHFQVPHHGSSKNHLPEFWNSIIYNEKTIAAISAGENKSYNHPDIEVVKFFDLLGINIHCTNYINGYKNYFDNLNFKTVSLINTLDEVSEEVIDERSNETTYLNFTLS